MTESPNKAPVMRTAVVVAHTYKQSWSPHNTLNTLRPRQDGRYFADDIFKCIFFNENGCILIKFSLKYVRKGSIDNNLPLVQIMAWRRSGDKPLSEPVMIILPTHICVTRPQWVNTLWPSDDIWRQRSGLTLVQLMVCYLTAPSHYLKKCWLIISKVKFIGRHYHERIWRYQLVKQLKIAFHNCIQVSQGPMS